LLLAASFSLLSFRIEMSERLSRRLSDSARFNAASVSSINPALEDAPTLNSLHGGNSKFRFLLTSAPPTAICKQKMINNEQKNEQKESV